MNLCAEGPNQEESFSQFEMCCMSKKVGGLGNKFINLSGVVSLKGSSGGSGDPFDQCLD